MADVADVADGGAAVRRPAVPTLVGAAVITQRPDDVASPGGGDDTLGLMVRAVRAAADDACGDGADAARLLGAVEWIGVPEGTWPVPDPARLVAERIGATGARTCRAGVGVLQQDVIARACAAIVAGELDVALVVGGEAKARAQAARRAGVDATEAAQAADVVPDEPWQPSDLGVADLEIIRNSIAPVTSFALIESALRAAAGRSPAEHRAHLGRLWSGFAAIAADLDWAWDRSAPSAEGIVTPSPENRVVADPYTRLLASQWNVDQAAALVLCSSAAADRFGIDPSRRVHPHASVVSNHSVPPPARADLAGSPGAALAAERVLELTAGGLGVGAVASVDLYSCFPAAVQLYAAALGLPLDDPRRLTVTGGMTFAGGPLNNYVLGAMVELARRLRAAPGTVGLSTSVSGSFVKQGLGTWSTDAPERPFVHADLSVEVAGVDVARPLVDAVADGTVVA
ncbi:MAG: hypothetical protein KDB36_12905, partial [Acidimicrobiales bacterium]|nr:hypothetical protein [Acidimicrobiales bacterium]